MFKTFNLPKTILLLIEKISFRNDCGYMIQSTFSCLFDRQTDLHKKGVVKFMTMKNDQKMELINIIRLLASYCNYCKHSRKKFDTNTYQVLYNAAFVKNHLK